MGYIGGVQYYVLVQVEYTVCSTYPYVVSSRSSGPLDVPSGTVSTILVECTDTACNSGEILDTT